MQGGGGGGGGGGDLNQIPLYICLYPDTHNALKLVEHLLLLTMHFIHSGCLNSFSFCDSSFALGHI